MADQTLARHVNELSILTMLRVHGASTRAEIARRLSITAATVTRLVSDLSRRELVREVGEREKGSVVRELGRPGVRIELNSEGAYFLGVEIDVGVLRYALLDLSASVIASSETRIPKWSKPRTVVSRISDYVESLEKEGRFRDRLKSVGVTVPGLVTSDGMVINLPILGWKNLDLAAILKEQIRLPCFVENDANAAAFGALYTEPALPSECTIFLKIGTGCGGAAIINGRLLRGAAGTAGEFGHIQVAKHGRRCSCGQLGCLEASVNLAAIARDYKGSDDLKEEELLALPAEIARSAAAADEAGLRTVRSFSRQLSTGIVALVNIFNPTTIILGGLMSPILEARLDDIRSRVAAGIVPGTKVPEVRLSVLGILDCAIGAASIAHHHLFDISNFELSDRNRLLELQDE
jgi:predicted NBD/HSP70 family sugar kinase